MKSPNGSREADIPFPSLLAFEATARLGSLSRAADELHLTQSAVSQRVLKLEAHVGQRLFVRQGRGVKLTGAGELLLQTLQGTLAQLRAGLARIEPYRSKASLLLACPADVAQGWLLPRLPALRALHPALEVWLMPERAITEIDRIDVDLVIARRPLHRADVECAALLEDESVAVCAPALAQRLGDAPPARLLANAPLLLLEGEPEWGGRLADPAWRGLPLQRAATIQDERLLLAAAEQGEGIAWLSALLAADALAQGRLVRLAALGSAPRERVWLMRSTLTPRTPLANRAFERLLALAREA